LKKVLVTGGAGFIGSHVVDKFILKGYNVVVVDNLSTGDPKNLNKRAKIHEVDITSPELNRIFLQERPDYVVHQAAQIDVQKSLADPLYDARVNIIGTLNILECSRKIGVKKLVYASSAALYGDPEYLGIDEQHRAYPMSNYGVSKYTPEHYLRVYDGLYGLSYVVLRYANVYGPRQLATGEGGVISIFINRMLNNKPPVVFGDGKQTRDFIYVEDVAEANLKAVEGDSKGVYNISTNKQTSVNQLVELLKGIIKTDVEPVYKAPRAGDIRHSFLDNTKAVKELKWKPRTTLYEGLCRTVEYYRSRKVFGVDKVLSM